MSKPQKGSCTHRVRVLNQELSAGVGDVRQCLMYLGDIWSFRYSWHLVAKARDAFQGPGQFYAEDE